MSKLVIESSDKNDSVTDIEEKLEKAVESIRLQRENKEFSDVFLKAQKDEADKIVTRVFDSMISEISEVLKSNDSVNKSLNSDLLKSYSKQGLVQKDVHVRGRHGDYVRKQWVSAGNNPMSKESHTTPEPHSKKSKSIYFPKKDSGNSVVRAFTYSDIMLYYSKHKSEIKVPIYKFIQQNYFESDGKSQTTDFYKTHRGYTRERLKLHDQIIQGIVNSANSPKNGEKPVAILMGGGSASGKGTIRSTMVIPRLQAEGINVGISDCDDIKSQLPEYEHFKAQDIESAAYRVHQESMDIALKALDALIANNKNLLFDGTMRLVDKSTEIIDKLHKAGYYVQIVGTDVPIEIAIERSEQRAKSTGRKVPHNIIQGSHGGFASTFPELTDKVDAYTLYDNSGSHPVVIQDENDTYRPDLLQKFIQKGQEYKTNKAIQRIAKTYDVPEKEIRELYSVGDVTLDEIEEYYSLGLNE